MRRHAERTLAAVWPAASLIVLLGGLALLGSLGSEVNERRVITTLINVVVLVGLYVFVGNTGVLSFGHISFMSIGAYVTALVTIPIARKAVLLPELPTVVAEVELGPLPAAFLAGGVAALFAGLLALTITRLSGLSAALAMFAVLVIVFQVAVQWDDVTRGSQTMLGVPANITTLSAFLWAGFVIAVAFAYQRSAGGLRVRAGRDDEFAARAAGISIPRERAVALVLSGFIVGIGGFMYAQFHSVFTPQSFFIHMTFLTIAMLVVGGQQSLAGAVVGAVVVSLSKFAFDEIEAGGSVGGLDYSGRDGVADTALAGGILLVLLVRRKGLMNGHEIRWPMRTPVGGLNNGE